MKKGLVVIFFFLCFIGLKAQSAYVPFPSNMVIYTRTDAVNSSWDPIVYTSYRSEITGDTLIGGFHYQKLYSGLGPFTLTAAIRNDTLNKKVYLYSVSSGTEKLLYDFNISVGDTVNRNDGYGFYQPLVAGAVDASSFATIDTAWVTSIDSVVMLHDGLYHRRFNFAGVVRDLDPDSAHIQINSSNPGPYNYSIGGMQFYIEMQPLIEGVGQIHNPVRSYHCFEHHWNNVLWCAYINGYSLLAGSPNPDLPLCYSIYTGVEAIKESEDLVLFPNPTSGLIQIKTDQKINSIEVMDVFGRRMLYSEKNQTEINISDFKNGVYFIRLSDSKGNSCVKKIIKN